MELAHLTAFLELLPLYYLGFGFCWSMLGICVLFYRATDIKPASEVVDQYLQMWRFPVSTLYLWLNFPFARRGKRLRTELLDTSTYGQIHKTLYTMAGIILLILILIIVADIWQYQPTTVSLAYSALTIVHLWQVSAFGRKLAILQQKHDARA